MTTQDLGPTWRWILGVVLTVLFALLSSEVRANASRVDEAANANNRQDREIGVLQAEGRATRDQLDRIERKLDRVLGGGQ